MKVEMSLAWAGLRVNTGMCATSGLLHGSELGSSNNLLHSRLTDMAEQQLLGHTKRPNTKPPCIQTGTLNPEPKTLNTYMYLGLESSLSMKSGEAI